VRRIDKKRTENSHLDFGDTLFYLVMRGAFVVRLGPGTESARGQFEGWVEEVDTGKRVKFKSSEELLDFWGRVSRKLCGATESSINARSNKTINETVETPRRQFKLTRNKCG
jgi:hypothetical protein